MTDAPQTQVLIVGGGPIGMAAAVELGSRGTGCRIVDPLLEPPQYAKAVGAAPGADAAATELPLIRDAAGKFAEAYAPPGPDACVVRPDGYLGFAGAVDPESPVAHLGATFGESR